MEREIIFRGKRIDNGEWIEGNLLVMGDDYWIVPNYKNASTRSTIEIIAQTIVRVEKETVGQYTGLKNNNGKLIFENNIVKVRGTVMETTEQERQSLIEMTIALSEFLNQYELDELITIYHGLIKRLKGEEIDGRV